MGKNKTIAYLRISTSKQDLDNQKLAILDYTNKQGIKIDHFIQHQVSSQKSTKERRIDQLLSELKAGDTLIVCELSRLGRSLGQIVQIVDTLVKNQVKFISLKENLHLVGVQNIQSKVTVAMFGLFAEIERDILSQRTREGLAAAKAKGKKLGRPKGALGKSKLDGKEDEIKLLLSKSVSKTSIAKILNVSRTALYGFIETRALDQN